MIFGILLSPYMLPAEITGYFYEKYTDIMYESHDNSSVAIAGLFWPITLPVLFTSTFYNILNKKIFDKYNLYLKKQQNKSYKDSIIFYQKYYNNYISIYQKYIECKHKDTICALCNKYNIKKLMIPLTRKVEELNDPTKYECIDCNLFNNDDLK